MSKVQAIVYAAICLGFVLGGVVAEITNYHDRRRSKLRREELASAYKLIGLPVPPENQIVCK